MMALYNWISKPVCIIRNSLLNAIYSEVVAQQLKDRQMEFALEVNLALNNVSEFFFFLLLLLLRILQWEVLVVAMYSMLTRFFIHLF